MRYILSYILYLIGDLISLTTMRFGKGYGYSAYQKIMLLSCDLDIDGKIWKYTEPNKPKIKKKR